MSNLARIDDTREWLQAWLAQGESGVRHIRRAALEQRENYEAWKRGGFRELNLCRTLDGAQWTTPEAYLEALELLEAAAAALARGVATARVLDARTVEELTRC